MEVTTVLMIAGALLHLAHEMDPSVPLWKGFVFIVIGSILMEVFMDITHWKP